MLLTFQRQVFSNRLGRLLFTNQHIGIAGLILISNTADLSSWGTSYSVGRIMGLWGQKFTVATLRLNLPPSNTNNVFLRNGVTHD
jgi:hypothetical protein